MATLDVTVKCSKETVELGEGLAKFLGDVKKALADGWQPLMDLPAFLSASIADLIPAMIGVEKVKDELTEDKEAFVNAVMVSGQAIVGAVLK